MVASVGSRGTLHKPAKCHSSEWTHVLRKDRNNQEEISEEALLELFN